MESLNRVDSRNKFLEKYEKPMNQLQNSYTHYP